MTKAADFATGMAAKRAFERTRPTVEVQSGADRIRAEVTDGGALQLRSRSDSSKTVEVTGSQALVLAWWILDTYGEPLPIPPPAPPAADYAKESQPAPGSSAESEEG